jgi:hypothetical protein
MAVFKVDGKEYEIRQPRGRNGRRATNWLITKVSEVRDESGGEGAEVAKLTGLIDDDQFLNNHLKAFVGSDVAKEVDENATVGEMLGMLTAIIQEVFAGFEVPEVDAALKNLEGAQEAE